ncbi:MAG: AhpC/TSA family protein, partial [Deltaproteobacteria bacterium]|nr:AhpC/TSA family protein [Deltaproteobacteria bacterium]
MELEALDEYASKIEAEGAMVVAISPMLPKYTKQAASKLKLSFPVL